MPNTTHGPVRLEHEGLGIYIWPDEPDWCVPDERGDFILSRSLKHADEGETAGAYAAAFGLEAAQAQRHVRQLLDRLERPAPTPYSGRAAVRRLDGLRECWLHVTDRCNARCRHCLFACSATQGEEMPENLARQVVDQALALGARVFYFTGGEPTLYGPLPGLIDQILRVDGTHAVILTNGLAARRLALKRWPRDRLHIQLSVDGLEASHDAVRGAGTFRQVTRDARALRDLGLPVTLAMAVSASNVDQMPGVVELARDLGIENLHYLWLFQRGHAADIDLPTPAQIGPHLQAAAERAAQLDVGIDNIEALRSQVFSLPGTRFDLSNAGWESLAISPAGDVYPSPAMIGMEQARCGNVGDGLEQVWRESRRLRELRSSSVASLNGHLSSPLRFITGGGDVDHSFANGGAFVGHDPYQQLYADLALWLIAREAGRFKPQSDAPALRLRMGDYLHQCDADSRQVMFTHSNCVLSLPRNGGVASVQSYYGAAAEEVKQDIVNPVRYDQAALAHIPEQARTRNYGCGSPVADAKLQPGQTVVDLGCGAGMECFVASSHVGPSGRVIGVDMLPQMLTRARAGAVDVARKLGYANVEFRQGFLDALPMRDASADVVISNCVINLCPHKRQVFAEILRILKPGGRLVIADVVSQDDIPLDVQYDETLRGECLGGAFRIDRLMDLLTDVGFGHTMLLKRFPYRQVQGHQFHSLTYAAVKPEPGTRRLIYRGPFAGVITEDGRTIRRGDLADAAWHELLYEGPQAFALDDAGDVSNVAQASSCCCFDTPEEETSAPPADSARHQTDCMACGAPLKYLEREQALTCHYCRVRKPANATCESGHFVCDACHGRDADAVIHHLLTHAQESDMAALLQRLRRHPAIPLHGPEHHKLIPGIIVTACRNAGGQVPDDALENALQRGGTIAGGACAFLGVCGAATGVGTGFSVLLGATPLKADTRQIVQQTTARVLERLGRFRAARCCQRDGWEALRVAAEVSEELLGVRLSADEPLECRQHTQNRECMGRDCPLWPKHLQKTARARCCG